MLNFFDSVSCETIIAENEAYEQVLAMVRLLDNEYRVLEEVNIAQSTPGDLRGDLAINAQKLADLYIALGLAHRYADGVTLIGRRQ